MKTNSWSLFVSSLLCLVVLLVALSCQLSPFFSSTELSATVAALATKNAAQDAQIEAQATIISYLSTRQPVIRTPGPRPAPTAYLPVRGSVLIEEGRCCVGGVAGEQIEVRVAFKAESPFGEVTQMRTVAGGFPFTEEQMDEVGWEPFDNHKSFHIHVAINWVGFYVSAQFRDEKGFLSTVFHDDISVEGHPPMPSPSP